MSTKVTLRKTIKEIWNSLFRKQVQLKIKSTEILAWTIIKKDVKLKKFEKMYNGYHVRYKFRFLKPILSIVVYIFALMNRGVLASSYIKTKDIDKSKANRVINVWNESLDQSCRETLLIMKKNIKGYENPDDFYYVKYVKMMNSVMMQQIMYDTFYRSMFEIMAINFTNNMNKAFQNDKKHILYNKQRLDDIDFYMATERNDGGHLIIEVPDGMIVVKKGDAIKINKANPQNIIDAIKKKEEEKKKVI